MYASFTAILIDWQPVATWRRSVFSGSIMSIESVPGDITLALVGFSQLLFSILLCGCLCRAEELPCVSRREDPRFYVSQVWIVKSSSSYIFTLHDWIWCSSQGRRDANFGHLGGVLRLPPCWAPCTHEHPSRPWIQAPSSWLNHDFVCYSSSSRW